MCAQSLLFGLDNYIICLKCPNRYVVNLNLFVILLNILVNQLWKILGPHLLQ